MKIALFTAGVIIVSAPLLNAQTYQEKIVASVLVAEATGEGRNGMCAVAEVIRQRCADKHKTPLQVVTTGGKYSRAFSCMSSTTPDRLYARWRTDENFPAALTIASTLVTSPRNLGARTKGATHYTRKEERPYWARGKRPVAVVGKHAFYHLTAY